MWGTVGGVYTGVSAGGGGPQERSVCFQALLWKWGCLHWVVGRAGFAVG